VKTIKYIKEYGGATNPLGAVGHLSRDVKLPTL
jgi:hypothetical protein